MLDMYVGGIKVYFKDRWNWVDCISLMCFILYYAMRIHIALNPEVEEGDNIVLWECSKLVNCFNLFFIWIKISWFLKLQKDLGVMT